MLIYCTAWKLEKMRCFFAQYANNKHVVFFL